MACSALGTLPVPPAAGGSRTSASGLTLHIEEHGCVGSGTGDWVGHGAVELAICTPGGDGESAAGRARCRAVCLLPPAIEVPGEHGAGGCSGGPAGEGSPLLLPQRARGQRPPVDGGAWLPQPCRSTQSTSELRGGAPSTQCCARPHQDLTCQAEHWEAEQQQRGEGSPWAAPEAPHGSRPGSVLGERQEEQGHGHIPWQPGVRSGWRMQPGRPCLQLCCCCALPVLQRGAWARRRGRGPECPCFSCASEQGQLLRLRGHGHWRSKGQAPPRPQLFVLRGAQPLWPSLALSCAGNWSRV